MARVKIVAFPRGGKALRDASFAIGCGLAQVSDGVHEGFDPPPCSGWRNRY